MTCTYARNQVTRKFTLQKIGLKKKYSGNAEYVLSLNMLDIDTNNILSYTNRIFRIFCIKKNIFLSWRDIYINKMHLYVPFFLSKLQSKLLEIKIQGGRTLKFFYLLFYNFSSSKRSLKIKKEVINKIKRRYKI